LSATPYEVLAEDLASELIFLAGQLGRLVEQYSWRFQHEKAVEIGEGARKGASAGGRAKARLSEIKRSSWQDEALNIWANRPDLSKRAVADLIIKRQSGEGRKPTAKHIMRYIIRPAIKK
jgi:hypothetical protein